MTTEKGTLIEDFERYFRIDKYYKGIDNDKQVTKKQCKKA